MTTATDRKTQQCSEEQHTVAMAADGRSAVALDRSAVRLVGGRAVMSAAGVLAVAMLDGAVWIVTRAGSAHTLHRIDPAGEPMAPPLALGALGSGVRLQVTRLGLCSALIEGERGVYVRDGAVLEDLGARGADRRVLMGGRGVMERRGDAMALRRPGYNVPLALPRELAAGRVVGGAMVLDGACAMIEVEAAGARTALVYELGRGVLKSRARLGDGAVFAVAERSGIVVVGRGSHLALLDLRAGRCVGERVLASPMVAAAIDANGKRLLVVDAEGRCSEIEASIAGRLRSAPAEAENRGEPGDGADARNDNAALAAEGRRTEAGAADPAAASDSEARAVAGSDTAAAPQVDAPAWEPTSAAHVGSAARSAGADASTTVTGRSIPAITCTSRQTSLSWSLPIGRDPASYGDTTPRVPIAQTRHRISYNSGR